MEAVGGAFLGAIRELIRAVSVFLELVLCSSCSVELSGRLESAIGKCLPANRKNKPNCLSYTACTIVTAMLDVAFMVAAAVMLIIIAYACNSGRMRWMLILGFAIGFFLSRVTVGRLIRKILKVLAIVAAVLIIKTIKMIFAPICAIKNVFSLKIKRKTKGGLSCEK